MYCPKCGCQVPAGAAFCPNCGAKVQKEGSQPSTTPSNAAQSEPTNQQEHPVPQSEQPNQPESNDQPNAASPASPSAPPVSPQSAPDAAQSAGNPLAAIVGKHADYYLTEFKKIDAGQKSRFNWAAFFLGPCMCFYRSCHELFKKYYLLYFILFGISCVIFTASSVSMAYGAFGIDFVLTGIYNVFSAVINTFVFIMQIRFAKNFNREYYSHCKQQLEKPASEQKVGTSAKKLWFFVLVVAVVWVVWYAATMFITQQVQNAYWNSLWADSSFSEDTYSESSSYYDETDSSVENTPYYEDDIPADENLEEVPPLDSGDYDVVGSLEILEKGWTAFLADSGEQDVMAIGADCDCDGLNEGFAVTAEEYDEDMEIYFGAKIYFIDSYGDVTLLCDTAPEGGALYGYPSDSILSPDSTDGFFVWNLFNGASNLSLVWGVQDGQAYESDISGQYNGVQLADTWGLAGYQFDYSQGYRDYAIYRLSYDTDTDSFTAIPDNAAYPAGEGPLA